MHLSIGYEPTTGNTLPAAVTDDGGMEVDIPYSGAATWAPTTPPHPSQTNQTMQTAVVPHHGAQLLAAPFFGGGGPAPALASNSSTSNQLILFQVSVNSPKMGRLIRAISKTR